MHKLIVIILAIQLLLLPGIGYAQEPQVEVQIPKESLKADLSVKDLPKQSLGKEADYRDPANYPLIDAGGFIGYLLDNYNGNHYIFYEDITTSTANENDMVIRLLYASNEAYQKDSIVTIEFLREENNYLNYLGNTEFDTYGATGKYLDSIVPKTLYDNQPYIYIRLGISESIYSTYYSDVTTFKVQNPFYFSENLRRNTNR